MLSKSEMIAHNLYAHKFHRFSFRHRKKEYFFHFIFNFFPFAINRTIVQNVESAKKFNPNDGKLWQRLEYVQISC